jgi:hypothetical protein
MLGFTSSAQPAFFGEDSDSFSFPIAEICTAIGYRLRALRQHIAVSCWRGNIDSLTAQVIPQIFHRADFVCGRELIYLCGEVHGYPFCSLLSVSSRHPFSKPISRASAIGIFTSNQFTLLMLLTSKSHLLSSR